MSFQEEVGEWAKETFPDATNKEVRDHLAREMIELLGITTIENAIAHTLAHKTFTTPSGYTGVPYRVYHGEFRRDQSAEEAADIYLLLLSFCDRNGRDLQEEARKKFEINKGRKWGPPDAEGVREHIREE